MHLYLLDINFLAIKCPALIRFFSQFACDVKAEIIGKPDAAYFHGALKEIDVEPEYVSFFSSIISS